jgi:DNA-binding transcriptional LysR family regulator
MLLDLASVRLFVLTAELGSLTRAAEAAATVQPVVSQRIKALEAALGRRLLERTPRFVGLTAEGAVFLEKARALLSAHDEALQFGEEAKACFSIGLSDHAVGAGLNQIIRDLRAALPVGVALDVRVGPSREMREHFDSGQADAVVLRRESGAAGGEVLGTDALGWRALGEVARRPQRPLPLILLRSPCAVRAAALERIEDAGLPWREVFIGGSCATLIAAVQAGLGIAPMGRIASGDLEDGGPVLGLPALPESEIVLLARARSPEAASGVRALERTVRSFLRAR